MPSKVKLYDLADEWNNAAVNFAGIKLNVKDTASAGGSLLMDLQTHGISRFNVRKDGFVSVRGGIDFYGTAVFGIGRLTFVGNDLSLYRDAANILAQRNGTNSQTFRVYNTYTDAANWEAAAILFTAAGVYFGASNAGLGVFRDVTLGGASVILRAGGSNRWSVTGSGHFISPTDGAYDIGASGANRPRNVYAAGVVVAGGAIGGERLSVVDGITAPTALAGFTRIYVDAADGDLKVMFGDGVVKTLATDTV